MRTPQLCALWAGAVLQFAVTASTAKNDFNAADARRRAEDLLSQMTWKEKIGQMGGIRRLLGDDLAFNQTQYDELHETQNGNLGYGSSFNWAAQVLPLANEARRKQINSTRLHIPFITVTDSVNGIFISGGTVFPSNLGMSASFNIPLFEQAVASIREEHRAIGTNWLLSPPLDVTIEPRYGRIGEDFGEDQYLVGQFGKAYVKTMEEEDDHGFVKVATTVKHFVYGECSGGVNLASQYGGINHLYNDQLRPYIEVISEAKPLAVMVSYTTVDRLPMHKNKYMLREVLRKQLGFEGLVMSDANGIWQLHAQSMTASTLQDAAIQAVRAGIEMELCPPAQPSICGIPELLHVIQNRTDIQQWVDDAVLAILQIKFRTGLFDLPLPDPAKLSSSLRTEEHLAIARQISQEGIVMLKNDGTLPHIPNNVAVIGPFADLINAGSYAAVNSTSGDYGSTLRQSFAAVFGDEHITYSQGCDIIDTSNSSGISHAVTAAKNAGFAVVMLGSLSVQLSDPLFPKRTDGEWFSHADLGFPGLQQQLLDAILDTGVPTVLVLSGGQPLVLSDSTMRSNAIFHSFLSGEFTGQAIVDLITGKINPSGKLTVSMPQYSGAIPINYNRLPSDEYDQIGLAAFNLSSSWQFPNLTREVPMPFGYGLSYTTFDFSDLVVSQGRGSSVTVDIRLKNTGNVFGKEVVQVYYRPVYTPDIEFPVKSLVRFEKVGLQPGESRELHFQIPRKDLGYWLNAELTSPPGPYTFWIGSSSRDQDLSAANVTLQEWTGLNEA